MPTKPAIELLGFEHLLGGYAAEKHVLDTQEHTYKITFLPIEELRPGKYQPRTLFDDSSLLELSKSIESNGIVQPLVVRSIFDNNQNFYEIVLGERRWRAAKLAGLKKVPVIIQQLKDDAALVFALVENVQREDLNPMDRILALARLQDEFSLTHEKIAEVVGLSRSSVTNLIRLSTLPEEIRGFLQNGELGVGHAKALLALEGTEQLNVAYEIVRKELSTRAAEELVQKVKSLPLAKKSEDPIYKDQLAEWSMILSDRISSPARVYLNQKGQGRVVIKIDSLEKLEKLIERLETTNQ